MEPLGGFLERVREALRPPWCSPSRCSSGARPSARRRRPSSAGTPSPCSIPTPSTSSPAASFQAILSAAGTENLIVVGSLTNVAVLYTATAAARVHRYNVVIPLDGVNAKSTYEHEYAIHQLSILPAGAGDRMRFTQLEIIEFA